MGCLDHKTENPCHSSSSLTIGIAASEESTRSLTKANKTVNWATSLCCAMSERSSAQSGNILSRRKDDLTKKHSAKANRNEKPVMMDVCLQVGEGQISNSGNTSSKREIASAESLNEKVKGSAQNFEAKCEAVGSNLEDHDSKINQESPTKSSHVPPRVGKSSPQKLCLSHEKVVVFADDISTSDTGNDSSPHTPDHISPDDSAVSYRKMP